MATLRNGGHPTEEKRKLMKRQHSAPNMRSPRVETVAPLSVYRPTEESRLIPPLSVVEHSKDKDKEKEKDKDKGKNRPSQGKIDRTKANSLRKGKADTIAPLSVFRPSESDSKKIIAPMSVYKHSDEKPVAPLSVYKPDEKAHGIAPLSVYRPSDEGSAKVVAPLSVYKAPSGEDAIKDKSQAATRKTTTEPTQKVAPLSIYRPEHKIVEPLSVYRSPNKGGIPPRSVFRQSASSESIPKHSDDDDDDAGMILEITDDSEDSKSPRSPRSLSPRSALQPPASPKSPRHTNSAGSTGKGTDEEAFGTSPKPAGLAAKMAKVFSMSKKSSQAKSTRFHGGGGGDSDEPQAASSHSRQKSNGSDKDDSKRTKSPKHFRQKSNESAGSADRSISPARSAAAVNSKSGGGGGGGNSPSPSRKHPRQTTSVTNLTGEPVEETKPVRKMRSNSTTVK